MGGRQIRRRAGQAAGQAGVRPPGGRLQEVRGLQGQRPAIVQVHTSCVSLGLNCYHFYSVVSFSV